LNICQAHKSIDDKSIVSERAHAVKETWKRSCNKE